MELGSASHGVHGTGAKLLPEQAGARSRKTMKEGQQTRAKHQRSALPTLPESSMQLQGI